MASIEDKKKLVLDVNTKLKFKCIDAADSNNIKKAREEFVKGMEARRNDPTRIAQSGSSLCGPAAFLYCVAREKPDDFANYVLDLALEGTARLGGLTVAPGEKCRDTVSLTVGERSIAPVDWVTLASLRDSANSVAAMESVDSDAAGITLPKDLAGWFEKTGWFVVRNRANKAAPNDPLHHLLGINSLPRSYICLFINANIMKNSWMASIPNHWVVLGDGAGKGGGSNGNDGTLIRIATPKMEPAHQHDIVERISCLPDTPACLFKNDPRPARRKELEQGKLTFRVYSWGGVDKQGNSVGIKSVGSGHLGGLIAEKFLPAYYGYVAATVK